MNPKQLVMQMLNQNPTIKNNPMIQNALNMAQQGNTKGLEELANNLAQSKGMSINDVRSKLGI